MQTTKNLLANVDSFKIYMSLIYSLGNHDQSVDGRTWALNITNQLLWGRVKGKMVSWKGKALEGITMVWWQILISVFQVTNCNIWIPISCPAGMRHTQITVLCVFLWWANGKDTFPRDTNFFPYANNILLYLNENRWMKPQYKYLLPIVMVDFMRHSNWA